MKIKSLFIYAMMIIATTLLISCNHDNDFSCNQEKEDVYNTEEKEDAYNDEKSELSITPTIANAVVATRSPISSFSEGAEIGQFVTSLQFGGGEYNNLATNSNARSTYSSGSWVQDNTIYVSREAVKVYAYYPYNSNTTDIHNVTIEQTSQTDYLYGTHTEDDVNSKNPNVNLEMKHALALVQFKFRRENYPHIGGVKELRIKDYSDGIHSSEGTINLKTGVITKIYNGTSAEIGVGDRVNNFYTIPMENSDIENPDLSFMVMPVTTSSWNSLQLDILVDNVGISTMIPSSLWESGKKYIYTITMTATGLVIDNNVTIVDWLDGGIGNITL